MNAFFKLRHLKYKTIELISVKIRTEKDGFQVEFAILCYLVPQKTNVEILEECIAYILHIVYML